MMYSSSWANSMSSSWRGGEGQRRTRSAIQPRRESGQERAAGTLPRANPTVDTYRKASAAPPGEHVREKVHEHLVLCMCVLRALQASGRRSHRVGRSEIRRTAWHVPAPPNQQTGSKWQGASGKRRQQQAASKVRQPHLFFFLVFFPLCQLHVGFGNLDKHLVSVGVVWILVRMDGDGHFPVRLLHLICASWRPIGARNPQTVSATAKRVRATVMHTFQARECKALEECKALGRVRAPRARAEQQSAAFRTLRGVKGHPKGVGVLLQRCRPPLRSTGRHGGELKCRPSGQRQTVGRNSLAIASTTSTRRRPHWTCAVLGQMKGSELGTNITPVERVGWFPTASADWVWDIGANHALATGGPHLVAHCNEGSTRAHKH